MDHPGDGSPRTSARAVATELYTLGGVRVLQQGSPLDVNLGSRHLALLIFLFHERRPMHPMEIVEMLGHGYDHDRELDGLKRTVKWLNQHVPFVNIRMTGETIEGMSGVWLDTMDMEAAIDGRKPARVADLYAGEFLEGFESGTHAFDEWANKERGRLKRAWDHAMSRAAREAETEGKWRTAAAWWKIVVTRAPMRGEPVAHLLEAYARTGRREEAIQVYSDYTDRLSRSGVAEVAGTVRQVVTRYPLLQGIAGRPDCQVVEAKPLVAERPRSDGPLPDWSLEPAPAPPDAFELTFELPEIEIPAQTSSSSARIEGSPADGSRRRATSPLSFHVLDEPVRADFGVGTAREWARRAVDELAVETVAMSFEKIAARASDSDPSDGNGGSGTNAEDVPDPPEGFSDNADHGSRDGNGNSAARDVPADSSLGPGGAAGVEDQAGPSNVSGSSMAGNDNGKPKSANSHRLEDSAPEVKGASEPVDRNVAPPRTPGQAPDPRDRDRDLYRATAAILAAFVEDDEEEDEHAGNGRLAGLPTPAEPLPLATPEQSDPEPWADFSAAATVGEAVETETPSQISRDQEDSNAFSVSDRPEAGRSSRSHESDRGADGQTVLYDPSYSTEFDLSDLDMDEFELYGGQVTRVRHQVTSVRKPWGPVLRRAWTVMSEWSRGLVGSLRAVSGRVRSYRAANQRPRYSEPAQFDEPWAMSEPTYGPSPIVVPDDSDVPEPPFRDQREDPTSRIDDSRAVVFAPSTSQIETEPPEEAPVEWFDDWDDGTEVDDPYGIEVDVYAPGASARVESAAAAGEGSLLRRYWYAPVGVIVLVAAFAFGPALIGLFGGRGGQTAESGGLSLPKPSLPKVSVRTPEFIETSIARISRLFSSPILESPGEWILVADLQSKPADDAGSLGSEPVSGAVTEVTPAALALALEADLMQARFFYVFPRGRALLALDNNAGGPSSGALSIDDAMSLASSEGISAVIGSTLYRQAGDDGDSLELEVFLPTGESVYRVSRRLSGSDGGLAALTELSREVRRRMGEPQEDLEASAPIPSFLSENPAAVNAYAEAFEHFNAGRYREARLAATAATRLDSSFASAYHLLARTSMELGARRQGRAALQSAVETSDATTERERLHILGDWLTLTGQLSDAALTYDELFNRHRDDVAALRSQAVVQRLIGAPGEGLGNLRVAYTIDRYDWPSLTQTARYLGYRGSLPSVDSLRALTSPGPDSDSND